MAPPRRPSVLGIAALILAACVSPTASSETPSAAGTSLIASASPSVAAALQPPASTAPSPIPTGTGTPIVAPGPTSTHPTACGAPLTVEVLGGFSSTWPIARLPDCFGNADLDVTGYLAPSWGIGGLSNGIQPAWLGDWAGLDVVLWLKPRPQAGCSTDTDCQWLFLHAHDATALALAPDRWVTVTGHFDDPVATTCRATGTGPDAVPSDAEAAVQCREHFVVTGIRTIAPPVP